MAPLTPARRSQPLPRAAWSLTVYPASNAVRGNRTFRERPPGTQVGAGWCALIEGDIERILRGALHSCTDERRAIDVTVAVSVLNRML
jgi:hypothetical protein